MASSALKELARRAKRSVERLEAAIEKSEKRKRSQRERERERDDDDDNDDDDDDD